MDSPSERLDPDALLAREGARLTVLAPHPDDESLAAGGLIQRALARGVPVDIVFATAGENNPWPQRWLERRVSIGDRERAAWAVRRRAEALAALRCLGAQTVGVHWLDWPDGGVTQRLIDDLHDARARVQGLLAATRPTLLVLPDLADRHPDHSALHVLVELALAGCADALRPQCLGYLLHGRARAGFAGQVRFALTASEQAAKRAAIHAHASQVALSRRRLLRSAGDTEYFVPGLAGTGAARRLPWWPPRALRPFLELLVVDAHAGAHVPLVAASGTNLAWRDGSPAGCFAGTLDRPCFAKLACRVGSPWVFDIWGWCRLDA